MQIRSSSSKRAKLSRWVRMMNSSVQAACTPIYTPCKLVNGQWRAMLFPSLKWQIKKSERIENSMASPAIQNLIQSLDNDLPRSALVQKKVRELAEGFNAEQIGRASC